MRMRSLVVMMAAIVTLLVGGSMIVAPQAQARECARPRGPLVAYGHSYLVSPEIGGATASYAVLAAAALRLRPVIRAVNGADTAQVDMLVRGGPTRWVPGSSDLVLIDSAINDIRDALPTPVWTAPLQRMLTALSARPAPTVLLVRPLPVTTPGHPGRDPRVIARYAAAQREVASRFPNVHIVDASTGWNTRLALSRDGIHPTTLGELHITRAVEHSARRAFCARSRRTHHTPTRPPPGCPGARLSG